MRETWRSVDEALAWAYRVAAGDIIKLSSLGKMRGAERQSSEATPHEIHAQAAIMMAHVQRLRDVLQAYVHARYWPAMRDQSSVDESYRAAMGILVRATIGALGTGVHSARAVHVCIAQYFERGESRSFQGVHWVQREARCRKATALEMRRAVWDSLDALQGRAWVILEDEMRGAGLLADPESPSP